MRIVLGILIWLLYGTVLHAKDTLTIRTHTDTYRCSNGGKCAVAKYGLYGTSYLFSFFRDNDLKLTTDKLFEGIFTIDDEQIKAKIPFKNGKAEGRAYLKKEDKGEFFTAELEINYKEGKKHGLQRYNQKHLSYATYSTEEHFVNGTKHGVSKIYDENGTLTDEVTYQNGLMQGVGKTYKNALLDSETPYLNGREHGESIHYFTYGDSVGKIAGRFRYERGNFAGATHYFESGNISLEIFIARDGSESDKRYYYENGVLSSNSTKNDSWTYYEDGSLKSHMSYKDGIYKYENYDKNGTLIKDD